MRASKLPAIKPRATSKDVARRAGVSQPTVSYVLNGTPGHTISAETRQRVLAAARALDYHVNSSARALGKGYTDEICLFIGEPMLSYTAAYLIYHTQERARQLGYTLATYAYDASLSTQKWKHVLESVFARCPAGVIGYARVLNRAACRSAQSLGVKACVLISSEPAGYAPTVTFALEQAGYLAGMHLVERGHQNIAFLAPKAPAPPQWLGLRNYLQGFKSALAAHGAALTPLEMNAELADARRTVDLILRSPVPPTALCGYRDEHCFVLLQALSERGLRVPEDIALVSLADGRLCELTHPPITAVRFRVQDISYHLIETVDALVHDKEPSSDLLISPPPELIVRASS